MRHTATPYCVGAANKTPAIKLFCIYPIHTIGVTIPIHIGYIKQHKH
jgi:hypothetical protein